MNNQQAIDIVRQALWTAFWLSAPLLTVGFLVSIVISLVQIVTSIQDSAFGTVPRLIAFLASLILLLPWMLSKMLAYTVHLIGTIGLYAR